MDRGYTNVQGMYRYMRYTDYRGHTDIQEAYRYTGECIDV